MQMSLNFFVIVEVGLKIFLLDHSIHCSPPQTSEMLIKCNLKEEKTKQNKTIGFRSISIFVTIQATKDIYAVELDTAYPKQ